MTVHGCNEYIDPVRPRKKKKNIGPERTSVTLRQALSYHYRCKGMSDPLSTPVIHLYHLISYLISNCLMTNGMNGCKLGIYLEGSARIERGDVEEPFWLLHKLKPIQFSPVFFCKMTGTPIGFNMLENNGQSMFNLGLRA